MIKNAFRTFSERVFLSANICFGKILWIRLSFFKTNYLYNCYKPWSRISFNKKENIINFAPARKELPNVLNHEEENCFYYQS